MRTFIAAELPENIKKELARAEDELKKADADVKWVKPENIHLTFKFLGDIESDKAEEIKKLLDKIAKDYKKFETSLFKIGAFPKIDYPRVIWVGIDKNCNIIEEIASKIDEGCGNLGFAKDDRQFSAHLTIGRVRSGRNKALLREKLLCFSINPHPFVIDKITLFQSTLTPKGPIYNTLHESSL